MSALTVRRLSEHLHSALKMRAAAHGRSAEAEGRDILKNALPPPHWLDQLRSAGQEIHALKLDDKWLSRQSTRAARHKRLFTGVDLSASAASDSARASSGANPSLKKSCISVCGKTCAFRCTRNG